MSRVRSRVKKSPPASFVASRRSKIEIPFGSSSRAPSSLILSILKVTEASNDGPDSRPLEVCEILNFEKFI